MNFNATVVSCLRSYIILEDGRYNLYRARRSKNFPLVCGDKVVCFHDGEVCRVIEQLPRQTHLSRRRHRGGQQDIVANITGIIVVTDLAAGINTFLIDSYLVACTVIGVKPILVFNKIDIATVDLEAEKIFLYYRDVGCHIFVVSAKVGTQVDILAQSLYDETVIMLGLSGVGKTSLANCLIPGLNARVAEISATGGEGRHTTSTTTLYHLPSGGTLIDSPGVRSYTYPISSFREVQNAYSEFQIYARDCEFADCRHNRETECAVRAAVDNGLLATFRYRHYLALIRNI